jgi:hypothetical protein
MCYEEKQKITWEENLIITNISAICVIALFSSIDKEMSQIMAWSLVIFNILHAIYIQIEHYKNKKN